MPNGRNEKCQLSVVFKNGTNIKVMIAENGDDVKNWILAGMDDEKVLLSLPSVIADERVEKDVIHFRPSDVLMFSVITPKAESPIHIAKMLPS